MTAYYDWIPALKEQKDAFYSQETNIITHMHKQLKCLPKTLEVKVFGWIYGLVVFQILSTDWAQQKKENKDQQANHSLYLPLLFLFDYGLFLWITKLKHFQRNTFLGM